MRSPRDRALWQGTGGSETGALVLGANYRALGLVRSLGRRRISVCVVKTDYERIATLSRYTSRSLAWVQGDENAEVDYLVEVAERHGLSGWTVFPTDDRTAVLVSRVRERLGERYIVAAPDWQAMRWAHDKRLTYQLGVDLGIDQPRTWSAAGYDELESVDWRPPAILKPAIKLSNNRFVREKAWPIADRPSLKARYEAARALIPPDEIMLQELIPGDGQSQVSFAALARHGRVLASITARRTRQIPMDFGRQSTYVETIASLDVAEAGRRVIEGMGYTGVVEIEFKRDARDGRLKLLDINPRVWGWHTLGARAGVDFSYLEWRMRHGDPVPEAHARPGVRWVRMLTDLPPVTGEILGGRLSIRAYLASLKGPLEHATMNRDDPLPGILEAPITALVHLRRRLRPIRRGWLRA